MGDDSNVPSEWDEESCVILRDEESCVILRDEESCMIKLRDIAG